MRRLSVLAIVCLVVAASACTPKVVPAPIVTTPKYPEFIQPAIPPSFTNSQSAASFDRAWRFLQTGDLKSAQVEFTLALQPAPAFYPAEIGLGYVEEARKDFKAALAHFDRALEREPRNAAALIARGNALVALDRDAEALTAFNAALAADPSLTDLRRRVEVMTFRGVERNLADAREAARAGRLDQAITAYQGAIASSPNSAFLYREVAVLERQKGDVDAALEHFRQAASLDPGDASSLTQIGELLEARGDDESALASYTASLAVESNPSVEGRVEALKTKAALARLPDQYRAIDSAAQITRADLAALIGVRLAPVLQRMRAQDAVLITDIQNNWAENWIMAVARTGVLEPFANHAFQPRTIVRRSDLAQALSRLVTAIAPAAQVRDWQNSRAKFSDLSSSHLAFPSASLTVAAGVLSADSNSFQPSRAVSGQEAIDAIDRLERMASLPARQAASGR